MTPQPFLDELTKLLRKMPEDAPSKILSVTTTNTFGRPVSMAWKTQRCSNG